MPTENESPLLTVEEVAKRLRLRPSTIYEAVAANRLPHIQLWRGRRKAVIRFRSEDLESFVRDRTFGPAKLS